MLVLTRKLGEEIKIGSNVIVRVVKCGRGAVKIGVEAPLAIRVIRNELDPTTADEFQALANV